jgi:dihydropteroate synthase
VTSLPHPGRTLVMGILNITPDSFSDGGRYLAAEAAIQHGLRLLAEGADIVDVGGESTRPGAVRVSAAEEAARVLPVISALAATGAFVSVDTSRSQVASLAVAQGASMVNDVSAGLADPAMLDTVARLGVGYVAMHWRGHSERMDDLATYDDVVREVADELAARRDAALAAGIHPALLVLDPGLGFSKTEAHNWALLSEAGVPRPPGRRDDATLALTALLATRGVWGVRTHTVAAHRDAVAVANRLSHA